MQMAQCGCLRISELVVVLASLSSNVERMVSPSILARNEGTQLPESFRIWMQEHA
jgi:hypothetical protein